MGPKASALIIGGSRGIGLALARETARRDIDAVIVSRTVPKDDGELPSEHVTADVSTEEGMAALLVAAQLRPPSHVFWVAGAYYRGDVDEDAEGSLAYVDRVLAMHQARMIRFLAGFHWMRRQEVRAMQDRRAYALTVVGSVSAFRLRPQEAVYAAAKAGQAQFLRTFSTELARDLPGSRILLVNCARLGDAPGEQKLDAGGRRIDPGFVSRLAWDLLQGERPEIMNRPFTEVTVERTSDKPRLTYGPQLPEIP